MKAKKKNKVKKPIILFICLFILFSILLYFSTGLWIGYNVKENCKKAQLKYQENCTSSLVKLIEDKNSAPRSINSAIWALGQLGDKKSLPILENLYTGIIPKKESYDKTISQHELKKAISLINGRFNITSFIWRNNKYLE